MQTTHSPLDGGASFFALGVGMETNLEWARYFASLGFSVIPVHTVDDDGVCSCKKKDQCHSAGKHPAINWQRYTKKKADDDTITMWFEDSEDRYGVGLVTGSISGNIFVVDVDVGEGKSGIETLDNVQMAHDDLPITATAITGSGGKHLFFRAPEGMIIGTDKNVLGQGVDVRGEGGFVVAAPSKHVSGRRYQYDQDDIADAPNWLLGMVEGHQNADTGKYDVTTTLGALGRVEDGREGVMMKAIMTTIFTFYEQTLALPTMDELVEYGWTRYESAVTTRDGRTLEEDGRGITAFTEKAGYQLARAKRGELTTLNAIKANMDAMGLKSNEEPEQTTTHHYEDGDVPTSEILRKYVMDAFDAETQRSTKLRIHDWHIRQFAGEPPQMEYLVEGIFPASSPALLAASGGTGKSFALLDLALKVALHEPDNPFATDRYAFGGKVSTGGTVVMLTAEDSADSVHRRLYQISTPDEIKKASERLMVVPIPDATGAIALINEGMGVVSMTEHYHDLIEQISKIDDLALVIIDPLQAFCWADVNADPKAAQVWWTAMSSICARTGASLIVAHHMRKDGLNGITKAEEAREAIRGSTALVDGARLVYAMWGISGDAEIAPCKALNLPLNKQSIVCGCVVKTNDIADRDVRFYARSKTGLLEDRTGEIEDANKAASQVSQEQIDKIFAEIETRWNRENPFSSAHNSGDRYLGRWIVDNIGLNKRYAKQTVTQWMDDGYLAVEQISGKTKKNGICVVQKPQLIHQSVRGFSDD